MPDEQLRELLALVHSTSPFFLEALAEGGAANPREPELSPMREAAERYRQRQRLPAADPKLIYRTLVQACRVLAERGAGRFVVGRHRGVTRFRWADGIEPARVRDLAQEVLAAPAEARPAPRPGPAEPRTASWHFPLRRGVTITLTLPEDITPGEAERLAAFVRTLPVEDKRS